MPPSRRRWMALTATGATLLATLGAWWHNRSAPPPAKVDAQTQTLRAWIDTLMPPEPDFPGALALGVAGKLTAAIDGDKAYQALTQQAITWLDDAARSKGQAAFSALDTAAREQTVAAAAASAPGSAIHTFFMATRDDVLFHAYADPRAWAGLGYAGPPQPIGFPDFARAPRKS